MKHNHKLVLIPEEKYNSLQTTRKQEELPLTVTEENSPEDIEHTYKPEAEGHSQPMASGTLPKLDTEVIISAVPKPWKNKARSIIQHIQAYPTPVLTWDDKGVVFIHGIPLPGSHISDLVKDSVKPYKIYTPRGDREYYQALREMNVPLGLIGNGKQQQVLQQAEVTIRGHQEPAKRKATTRLAPPPGIPVKRRRKTLHWMTF